LGLDEQTIGGSEVDKKCSNCGEMKSLNLFGKNKRTKDGFHYYCKDCQNEKMKKYFKTEKGKEALKKTQAKYLKTEKGREKLNESIKRYFKTEKGQEKLKKAINKKRDEGYYRFGKGAIPILRAGATRRGIDFNLTPEQLETWWLSTKDNCYYCKMSIEEFKYLRDFILNYEGENIGISKFKRVFVSEKQAKINWMTLDRQDNNLGYEIGNIVKCCWFCNYIKRDFLSEEDMLQIAEGIINRLRNEIQKETEKINPI
jgi:hypothetical protein